MKQADTGTFIFGTLIGMLIGAAAALWYAPFSGSALRHKVQSVTQQTTAQVKEKVESVVPADPVAESIAEGKAAARRRRDELGLGS